MPIDGERRIRLVPREHQIDGLASILQRGVGKLAFGKDRGEPRRDQENVAFAQGHIKLRGEVENHLAAWLRAAGFEKAQVARGDFRVTGEIELAQAAALAPFAEKTADRLCGHHHEATIAQAWRADHSVRGNRQSSDIHAARHGKAVQMSDRLCCRPVMKSEKGKIRWRVHPARPERRFITLLARLDANNCSIFDMYVVPNLDHKAKYEITLNHSWLNRGKRLNGLSQFLGFARQGQDGRKGK